VLGNCNAVFATEQHAIINIYLSDRASQPARRRAACNRTEEVGRGARWTARNEIPRLQLVSAIIPCNLSRHIAN